MKAIALASLALLLLLAGCAPPKVLVNHVYASDDKSIETFIIKAATVGSGKDAQNLFNVYMRVCNQEATNATSACKETLILENVNPRSL